MAIMRKSCNNTISSAISKQTPGVGQYDLQKSMDYVMNKVASVKIGRS
jgi:hypothetical protein